MNQDIQEIRRRSGVRDMTLDINAVPEPFEVFVHHVHEPGHHPVEVHMPIEWVGIGPSDELMFSREGQDVLADVRKKLQEAKT